MTEFTRRISGDVDIPDIAPLQAPTQSLAGDLIQGAGFLLDLNRRSEQQQFSQALNDASDQAVNQILDFEGQIEPGTQTARIARQRRTIVQQVASERGLDELDLLSSVGRRLNKNIEADIISASEAQRQAQEQALVTQAQDRQDQIDNKNARIQAMFNELPEYLQFDLKTNTLITDPAVQEQAVQTYFKGEREKEVAAADIAEASLDDNIEWVKGTQQFAFAELNTLELSLRNAQQDLNVKDPSELQRLGEIFQGARTVLETYRNNIDSQYSNRLDLVNPSNTREVEYLENSKQRSLGRFDRLIQQFDDPTAEIAEQNRNVLSTIESQFGIQGLQAWEFLGIIKSSFGNEFVNTLATGEMLANGSINAALRDNIQSGFAEIQAGDTQQQTAINNVRKLAQIFNGGDILTEDEFLDAANLSTKFITTGNFINAPQQDKEQNARVLGQVFTDARSSASSENVRRASEIINNPNYNAFFDSIQDQAHKEILGRASFNFAEDALFDPQAGRLRRATESGITFNANLGQFEASPVSGEGRLNSIQRRSKQRFVNELNTSLQQALKFKEYDPTLKDLTDSQAITAMFQNAGALIEVQGPLTALPEGTEEARQQGISLQRREELRQRADAFQVAEDTVEELRQILAVGSLNEEDANRLQRVLSSIQGS